VCFKPTVLFPERTQAKEDGFFGLRRKSYRSVGMGKPEFTGKNTREKIVTVNENPRALRIPLDIPVN
jgi:hypothetical protein